MKQNNYSRLTEGRYVPHGDTEFKIVLDRINSDGKRQVVYTGTMPTYDIYEEKQTGYIAHSIQDALDPSIDLEKHIENNRWKQIIQSEIARQVEDPYFAKYNFSFLNSVHNSSIKTRA